MSNDERRPTPSDAKRRATVRFRVGNRTRTGTLTYWPGARSTRPATVMVNGVRFHPEPGTVTLLDEAGAR
jgi:hypothetical protein